MTQQQFAAAANISIRSVAKYDTGGEPAGKVLVALAELARSNGFDDLVGVFSIALAEELGLQEPGMATFVGTLAKNIRPNNPPTLQERVRIGANLRTIHSIARARKASSKTPKDIEQFAHIEKLADEAHEIFEGMRIDDIPMMPDFPEHLVTSQPKKGSSK